MFLGDKEPARNKHTIFFQKKKNVPNVFSKNRFWDLTRILGALSPEKTRLLSFSQETPRVFDSYQPFNLGEWIHYLLAMVRGFLWRRSSRPFWGWRPSSFFEWTTCMFASWRPSEVLQLQHPQRIGGIYSNPSVSMSMYLRTKPEGFYGKCQASGGPLISLDCCFHPPKFATKSLELHMEGLFLICRIWKPIQELVVMATLCKSRMVFWPMLASYTCSCRVGAVFATGILSGG